MLTEEQSPNNRERTKDRERKQDKMDCVYSVFTTRVRVVEDQP